MVLESVDVSILLRRGDKIITGDVGKHLGERERERRARGKMGQDQV